MHLIIFKTSVLGKSLIYGALAGGSIQGIIHAAGDAGSTSLWPGLFSMIGVLGVALIAAFVNLKMSKNNSGVDMKEVRRLKRENAKQDRIIEALIKEGLKYGTEESGN